MTLQTFWSSCRGPIWPYTCLTKPYYLWDVESQGTMVLTQQHQIAAAASKAFSTCSKAVWNSTRLSLTKGRSCRLLMDEFMSLSLIFLTDTCIIVTATCILQIIGFSNVQVLFAIHPHRLYSFVWPLNQFSHVRIYLGHLIVQLWSWQEVTVCSQPVPLETYRYLSCENLIWSQEADAWEFLENIPTEKPKLRENSAEFWKHGENTLKTDLGCLEVFE